LYEPHTQVAVREAAAEQHKAIEALNDASLAALLEIFNSLDQAEELKWDRAVVRQSRPRI